MSIFSIIAYGCLGLHPAAIYAYVLFFIITGTRWRHGSVRGELLKTCLTTGLILPMFLLVAFKNCRVEVPEHWKEVQAILLVPAISMAFCTVYYFRPGASEWEASNRPAGTRTTENSTPSDSASTNATLSVTTEKTRSEQRKDEERGDAQQVTYNLIDDTPRRVGRDIYLENLGCPY